MKKFFEAYEPEVDDYFDALDTEYLSIEALIEKEATADCDCNCEDCPNYCYCPYFNNFEVNLS